MDCYNVFPFYCSKKEQAILPSTSFSFGFRDEPIDICMIKIRLVRGVKK